MGLVRRVLTGFLEEESGVPQMVQRADGSFWVRAVDGSEAQVAAGGGSVPVLTFKDFAFVEPSGAHANLVKTFPIPAGMTIADVLLYGVTGPWADGDSASFKCGDTANPTGFYDPADITLGTYLTGPYDPTTGPEGPGYVSTGFKGGIYGQGAGNAAMSYYGFYGGLGVLYPGDDTLTMTVAGIATGGGGGEFRARVIYIPSVPLG